MPQITIPKDVLAELQSRLKRVGGPAGVRILGPMAEDSRAPSSLEEAWALEKLYGPPQKWICQIVPISELEEDVDPDLEIYLEAVDGIPIAVITSQPVEHLRFRLHGDAIRIYESEG